MDDRNLVTRARRGEEDAFVELLDKYQQRVFRYFARCFDDQHLAEDLTQTVFSIVLQQIFQSNKEWKFFSRFLFKICKNTALKQFRQLSQQPSYQEEMTNVQVQQLSDPIEQQEALTYFYQNIARLPMLQRQILLLKFIEGFSLKEIATILEVPVNTVKSHIHRGKQQLRIYMQAYYREEDYDDRL